MVVKKNNRSKVKHSKLKRVKRTVKRSLKRRFFKKNKKIKKKVHTKRIKRMRGGVPARRSRSSRTSTSPGTKNVSSFAQV